VLLVFGKRRLCESLSTDWFARERGLTWAETRVLQGLTSGLRPIEIAQRQGVALSTVRSQVRSLRAKTGAASIGALLGQVSSLPPMLNTLRCTGP
jgi:DNA-binding CsgD family transcriptional regulator